MLISFGFCSNKLGDVGNVVRFFVHVGKLQIE